MGISLVSQGAAFPPCLVKSGSTIFFSRTAISNVPMSLSIPSFPLLTGCIWEEHRLLLLLEHPLFSNISTEYYCYLFQLSLFMLAFPVLQKYSSPLPQVRWMRFLSPAQGHEIRNRNGTWFRRAN